MNDEKILDSVQGSVAEPSEKTCDTTSQDQPTQITEDVAKNPPNTKKKKLSLLIATAGVIIILAVMAIFFMGGEGTNTGGTSKTEALAVSAKMADDGTAYIPLMDGNCITINDDVKSAVITKDRKYVVVLLKNGTLYVTNKEQSAKNEIADNCDSISNIRNDGFFYTDVDKTVYRVTFADFSTLKLGDDVAFVVAENNISVIFATAEGNIYTVKSTATDSIKVGSYSDSVELETISDNGEISVWVTEKNDTQTIVLNEGDDRVTLGEVDDKYNYTYTTFTEDQGILVVRNSHSDCLWIKYSGKEPIKAKLGAEPADFSLFTSKGYLSDMQSGNVKSLYISTEADTGSNVYNISMDGDRERILSKVTDYNIANGNIVYTDTENTLYFSKLNGNSVSDEIKIASDVDMFELTDNGKYVYYMKDCENEAGSLYCYKIGEADSLKIASDVACYNSSWGSGRMYTKYSVDGASVFFFKDMEEIPNTYSDQGTLMLWSYGNENASKISSDVMNYSLTSGLDSGAIKTKSFVFMKYNTIDSDENIFANWMYHNGKEATKFAADVIR